MQFLYLKNILNKNIKLKYERLEKLSREAEKQGLSFALDKDTIYDGVNKSGVKEGTKDGLLKEAGFTNSEREAIKKQEVKEGSKKLEDRAVERMNSAVERIYMEAVELESIILKSNLTNKEIIQILNERGFKNKNQVERAFVIIRKIEK